MTNDLAPRSAPSSPLSPRPALARHDGWTADKQRGFCQVLAETGSVEQAAQCVGMSKQTAYRFRSRAAGRAFALAWNAALLIARQRLIDEAFELAAQGTVDTILRDGQVIGERRRRDARTVLSAVARLASADVLASQPVEAVAQDFEEFLGGLADDPAEACAASAEFLAEHGDRLGMDGGELSDASSAFDRAAAILRDDAALQEAPPADPGAVHQIV